jgi:hypothetical protein
MRICSHTRAGVHLFAKLIQLNFQTDHDYEYFHYSHSRVCPEPFIHLHRPCLPTMVSMWRSRTHLGIADTVTFPELLRHTWDSVPKAETCEALFNGQRRDQVCAPHPFDGTFLDRWVAVTYTFQMACTISFPYQTVVDRPLAVIDKLAQMLPYRRNKDFTPVTQRMGWQPVSTTPFNVTGADYRLIEEAELCLRSRLSVMGRRL